MIPTISKKELERLRPGESRVFMEPEYAAGAGAVAQTFAKRAKMKIRTQASYLITLSNHELTKLILVTRIERGDDEE